MFKSQIKVQVQYQASQEVWWQVFDQFTQEVYGRVFDQVWNQVVDPVRDQQVLGSVRAQIEQDLAEWL